MILAVVLLVLLGVPAVAGAPAPHRRRAHPLQPRRLGRGAAEGGGRHPAQGGRQARARLQLRTTRARRSSWPRRPTSSSPSCGRTGCAGTRRTWTRDAGDRRLRGGAAAKYRYVAIGEFHLFGADAELPVPRRIVELAKQYGLMLHAHSDADAIERLFRQYPEAQDPVGALRLRAARARARDAAQAQEPLGRPRLPQRPRLRRQGDRRSGGRPSSSSPTASWSAPTPSCPSAGTTCPSTPPGRAAGSPTCRPTWPSGSRGRTARRSSAGAARDALTGRRR